MASGNGIVYSTGYGRMCPACGKPVGECVCRQEKTPAAGDGIVRVSRQTKGRKGKGVTIITGLGLEEQGLQRLAADLKRRCGAGGTVKGDTIEIQGDHRDRLLEELSQRGYTVKRAGNPGPAGRDSLRQGKLARLHFAAFLVYDTCSQGRSW
jgi:translation initiation factor 1